MAEIGFQQSRTRSCHWWILRRGCIGIYCPPILLFFWPRQTERELQDMRLWSESRFQQLSFTSFLITSEIQFSLSRSSRLFISAFVIKLMVFIIKSTFAVIIPLRCLPIIFYWSSFERRSKALQTPLHWKEVYRTVAVPRRHRIFCVGFFVVGF